MCIRDSSIIDTKVHLAGCQVGEGKLAVAFAVGLDLATPGHQTIKSEVIEPIANDDLSVANDLPVCPTRQKQARQRIRRNDVLVHIAVVCMR